MGDWGYVLAGYAAAAAGLGTYLWSLRRRERRVREALRRPR